MYTVRLVFFYISHLDFCNYNIVFAYTRSSYVCITGWRISSVAMCVCALYGPYLLIKLHAYESIRAKIVNSTDT